MRLHPILSDGRLRRLFDSGVVGVVVWSSGGAIHDANDRFLRMIGYTRADLEAKNLDWRSLTPPEWLARDDDAINQLQLAGAAEPTVKEYVRRDGGRVFVRLLSAALDDDPTTIVSTVIDISQQRQAEMERDALLERERRAREAAEAAVQARDELLAIVSHDLRNPLNSISIGASMLATDLGEADRVAHAGIIHRAIDRMSRLIDDLLDIHQITSGLLSVDVQPVELRSLVEEVRTTFDVQMSAKSQRWLCLAEGDATLMADKHRIVQALSNLVGNACKFTPEGGEVSLRAVPREGVVEFSVSDSGPGVGENDLHHIFERFWQSRRVRRGGVGLGLPITKGIIDAHGGTIWAESRPGRGTTFSFTIPTTERAPSRSPTAASSSG